MGKVEQGKLEDLDASKAFVEFNFNLPNEFPRRDSDDHVFMQLLEYSRKLEETFSYPVGGARQRRSLRTSCMHLKDVSGLIKLVN